MTMGPTQKAFNHVVAFEVSKHELVVYELPSAEITVQANEAANDGCCEKPDDDIAELEFPRCPLGGGALRWCIAFPQDAGSNPTIPAPNTPHPPESPPP